MKYAAKLDAPKEKEAVALGDEFFHRRSGPFDFSCSTCHAAPGLRIRLQELPYLENPAEAKKVVGEWPAYRVSSTHVMTMQHRLLDCYWQMRMPQLQLGSDVSVALIAYLTKNAEGGDDRRPGPEALIGRTDNENNFSSDRRALARCRLLSRRRSRSRQSIRPRPMP